MILTTHALVGAAIGKYIHNPIALTAILIPLHYTLDIFRHGEYLNKNSTFKNTTWKVLLDLFIGGTIILFAIYAKNISPSISSSIIIGAIISMFPDLLTVLYWKLNFKFLEKIYKFHQWVHKFPHDSKERQWTFRNARNDIIFSILAIFLLFL
ncbi:MAG: hypothetical protein US57_C0005G0048 [Candidatus Moranbacteria bacterium GW2011_GWC2_37_73]|nr:MAG: hypothetical protein UR95_C0001G0154 [Parcubacteria group bacterium GW2011_GWC1_36_108]KKQ00958.1 MAG: hypothetical protein US10_C0023G0003 [Candidatus Moranbacteria bacterium GW2011_GWD2_36_198]KKQ01174.1 MAG: hypothetical protein US09_C0002G0012 [Candidatus Moranbacteria bacterium GW2011_GWD1_36_198]KKQ40092.1 MAG: hypothetical protein US57_C0005G0048 [Candidatus Moranbacteria bacterium GW2011_GWC2_37_73]HAR99563.1 hypothetical protein [Candidatus Moranbacteria bacterium]